MRIGINLKLIRRILVISLLSFSIVLGVKYVLDLREVYNRVDFVVEEDRRKYLEIFNGFLVSAANSFERKFVRFASDLSAGKYEDPAEDSRKSNTLSGMFSQSYEKTFFLVCTNWMENVCGESTFPFMHNVKMWIRDDRIFDSAADVHSRLFHLDDAFFLAFVSSFVKDGQTSYFVGIFDIAEFMDKNLSDGRFLNMAVDKEGEVLFSVGKNAEKDKVYFIKEGNIDEYVHDKLKKVTSGSAEFYPADSEYKENYAFMWDSAEINKEDIIILSSFVKGTTFSDLNYVFVSRFPLLISLFIGLIALFSLFVFMMRIYVESEKVKTENTFKNELRGKTSVALKSEKRVSELFEKAGMGFIIWNGYGETPVCDEGFTKITGYDCGDYSYDTWSNSLYPMDKNRVTEAIEELLRDGTKESDFELRLKRKDGVWIWLAVNIFKTDPAKNPRSITVLFKDITEFKKRELILRDEKQQAEKQTQDKSVFLASMSHEIRTPVNGVIGISKILSETDLDDDQAQYVSMIRTAANNLIDVINDILDISKIEANMMRVKNVNFNLRNLIEKQLKLYAYKAHEKSLEMNLFISSDTPDDLYGDPQMIQQVLINLINNAIKFTEKGEVNIMVYLLEKNENAVNLKFVVEDTGIGIGEEDLKMVFESFIQIDNHVQSANKGTGLGLAISKKLVQLMGGKISLKSIPDKGTVFFFEIPFNLSGEVKNPGSTDEDFCGKRILLIDNHITAVNFLSKMLSDMGANVYSIMSVEELPSVIYKNDFDLILIDSVEIKGKKVDDVKALFGGNTELMCRTCIIKRTNELLKTSDGFCCASSERGILKPVFVSDIRELLVKNFEVDFSKIIPEEKPNLKNEFGSGGTENEDITASSRIYEALIVEDDPINLKVIEIVLRKFNLKTTSVTDGQMALEEYHRKKYDVVFMDISIPKVDGWEITRRIREEEKSKGGHVPIIGLSSHVMEEEVKKAFESGMDRYITKPIDQDKVAGILEDLSIA